MMRRKNLERAVILGLLLSTGVYGSAWAEDYIKHNEQQENQTLTYDNIRLTYDQNFTGTSPIWIGGTITAANEFTINNTKVDETKGKGINAYQRAITISAKKIKITTYDDGIFTTGPTLDGGEALDDQHITLKDFDSLDIVSTNGFGVINNGNSYGKGGLFGNPNNATNKGDIYITGNDNSIINIQGGYKNDSLFDAKAAVKNGFKGKIYQDSSTDYKTVVSGGNIKLFGVGYGTWAETGQVEIDGTNNNINAILDDRFTEKYTQNSYKNFGIGVYNQKDSATTTITAVEQNYIHGDKEAVKADGGNITITGKVNKFNVSYNKEIVKESLQAGVENVDRYAIHTTSGNVNAHATDGNNEIYSIAAGIYGAGKGTVTLTADNGKNIIYAGDMIEGQDDYGNTILYGDDYGIRSEKGNVTTLEADVNNIKGAIYANGSGSNVYGKVVEGTAADNYVYSAVVIEGAGDLEGKTEIGENEFTGMDVVSALYGEEGAQINLSGVNDIRTYYNDPKDEHTSERAVWAYKGANITLDGTTNISTYKYEVSPENRDIAIAAGTATKLDSSNFTDTALEEVRKNLATVNLNYQAGSSISGDILAAYGGEVHIKDNNITTASVGRSNAATGIAITGDLLAGNTGKLTVDLGNGGSLTGRADDYGDASTEHIKYYNPAFSSNIIQGGDVTLNMGDDSRWDVQGQSWITTVNTNGNALIDLTNVSSGYKDDYASHALTIRNLNGDANIKMELNGDRSQSDMLYIGQGNGEYNIELAELVTVGDMYANLDDNTKFSGLRFATVGAGSDVKFNVTAKDQGFNNVIYTVDTDVYNSTESVHENNAYNGGDGTTLDKPGNNAVDDLLTDVEQAQKQANQIMLLTDENNTANADENDSKTQHLNYKLVDMQSDGPTDAGKTMLNMSRANYSNAIYMDRLNKRLGEARYINDDPEEDEGMWVRIRHDRIGKEDAFRSQNTMYELGYDKRQECDNGKRRVGFAVDYMHGDTGYSDIAGKGEIDRYGLWLYDTWTGNKGHYADYVAKWGHLQNDFEVYTMTGGEKVTGDYSNNVFSISAEYGRKKDMGNDWYIEPQAQLQLARVTGADYTTSQGTKVSVDGINSLIGRAGFRIGKDFGEEKQSTLYFKADVLHEFLGDQTIRALDGTTNGWQSVDYENQGTWYDIGIGYAAMLSQSTYAFIDLEQSFGNDNDDTYQINAGVRWTF